MNTNLLIVSSESLLFFVSGALLGINKINIQNIKFGNKYILITLIWILLIAIKTTFLYFNYENELAITVFHKTSILFGILSIWLLYDRLFGGKDISKTKFYTLSQFTFFLYAFHEPVLTIFKKAFYFILGTSELSSLLIYILAPTVTIFVSVLAGYYMKKIVPRFYYILTGGR